MIRKNTLKWTLLMGLCLFSCKETEKMRPKMEASIITNEKKEFSKQISEKEDVNRKENVIITDSLMWKELKTIEGKYTATTCDKSRFSIELEGKGKRIGYKIFDKHKIFASGRVNVIQKGNKDEFQITMGAIGAMVKKDTLVVQNYGNSMNAFDHFGECPDKYLQFIK
ncbi:hypothetical protein [Chryseobacterium potabilaquae]|nr:hypothetical protein [Chryseobacterium potabilaquae]